MRIISGKLKGKPISFVKTSNTRPLKDSVKENIFNILTHSNLINIDLHNANILDLYSGTGSFGLEAISRGASKVTFIEENKAAIKVLKENLNDLQIEGNAIVFENKIINVLKTKKLEKYDIFFLDPPFADNSYIDEIELIKTNKIYKKNHLIIIHRERNTIDNFNNKLSFFLEKTYGRSKILFGSF